MSLVLLIGALRRPDFEDERHGDRKSTRLNSSHANISYAVFCLKKKKINNTLIEFTACVKLHLVPSDILHISLYYLFTSFIFSYSFFFFNDPPTTEIYTLSLHDALPIFPTQDLGTTGFVKADCVCHVARPPDRRAQAPRF